jgi:hypothetical protein
MSAWRDLVRTLTRNPISTFAVLCVACTAAWLGYMSYRLLVVVESADWCGKAIQAERITPGNTFVGLIGCIDILKIQLGGAVNGFYIAISSFAFSLIVLIVVVVAGAKASAKLPGGLSFNVGKEDVADAAQHVADEAQVAATEVKDAAPDAPKVPDYAK